MSTTGVSPTAPKSQLAQRGRVSSLMRIVIAVCSGIAWSLPLVGPSGTLAAGIGAGAGALLGQLLGARRLRLAFALPVFASTILVAWGAAAGVTGTRMVAESMGPGTALALGSSLRAGVLAFAAAGSLRLAAVKRPQLGALELVVASVGIALIFAGHRDGVVARPLWFADWAAERDLDPKLGLMFVGGLLALTVCLAAALETRRPWAMVALLPLALVGLFFATFVDARDLPQAQAANDLGLTDPNIGLPPRSDPNEHSGDQPQGQGQGQGGSRGERQPDDPLQEALRGSGQDQRDGQGGGGGGQGNPDQGGGGQGNPSQPSQGQGGGSSSPPPSETGQGGASQQAPDLRRDASSSGQSPAPMAVVILGDDYEPPTQAYYFRQQVWSQYSGGRLIETRLGGVDRDTIRSFPTRRVEVSDPPPSEHHKLVRATVTMVVRHVSPFALESVVSMQPATNPRPGRFWRAYSFESLAPTWEPEDLIGRSAGDATWTEEQWAYYLRGPEDPRYAELARSLVEALPEDKRHDPFMQALAVKLWMDQHLTYSTNERHAGVSDPTADFLFGNRIGYCVHFAHAAVYMWRSLGIPARVSAGYHVQQDEVQGSTILIQGNAAHAWPELYLDGVGWVILDIAAEQNLDPPSPPADAELAQKLGDWAREVPEEVDEETGEAPAVRQDYRQELALASMAMLLAFLFGTWSVKLWRRLIPAFCGGHSLPRVAYRRGLDRLAEAGVRRRRGESRESFATRVAANLPAFSEMTALHLMSRFSDPARPEQSEAARSRVRWRELDRKLRSQLRSEAPLLRRLVGWINPLSFLGAR